MKAYFGLVAVVYLGHGWNFFFGGGGGVWVVTHFSITPLKSIEKLFVVDFDYGDNGSFAFHRFHCYSY